MGNQDEINQFAHMLDLLAKGRNVASNGLVDSRMVRIACMLAATDLSGLSRNRETLRRRLSHQTIRADARPKPEFSMLAAFSMGFATMIVLAYVSLVIILPLAQQGGREPSVAEASPGGATLNAMLAAVQRLASPTASPTAPPTASLPQASANPEASPTATPTALPPADTEPPPAASAWTTVPAATVAPPTPTWAPMAPSTWSPPPQVDSVVTVMGDAGTQQQFSASLPSESGSRSQTIQVVVDIPAAEGDAGRRRVDYAVTCSGAGSENLHWGWWGWPPASFVCGSVMTSDGLLWSQNVVYFVIEVPDDGTTSVIYTLTVTVDEYAW